MFCAQELGDEQLSIQCLVSVERRLSAGELAERKMVCSRCGGLAVEEREARGGRRKPRVHGTSCGYTWEVKASETVHWGR